MWPNSNAVDTVIVGTLLGHDQIVTGNLLTDYSYVTANATPGSVIARCVTGLGPNATGDNSALGGLYFAGSRMPNKDCGSNTTAIQPNGAPISNFVGVINLYQCGSLPTTQEGIYTCTMMTSSMISQSMRLGVYINGRSKSIIYLCIYECMYVRMSLCVCTL